MGVWPCRRCGTCQTVWLGVVRPSLAVLVEGVDSSEVPIAEETFTDCDALVELVSKGEVGRSTNGKETPLTPPLSSLQIDKSLACFCQVQSCALSE